MEPPPVRKDADGASPVPEVMKYQPPSEALQKIPFLRKSEDEIYADQMRQVLVTLKQTLHRMDGGGNETQLAGVITMRPDKKFGSDEEGPIPKDEATEGKSASVMKDLVNRLTSALTEVSSSGDSSASQESEEPQPSAPEPSAEDPISEILAYRAKYFDSDQELIKLFASDGDVGGTRDQKLIDEAYRRSELRRQLITSLIDYFFATEMDDDTRVEKAYHYALSESEQQERKLRLETAIFGPKDLIGGGLSAAYVDYLRNMGYTVHNTLRTFITSSDMERLKESETGEQTAFYADMKIRLKLERRIKVKVIEQYLEQRSELWS